MKTVTSKGREFGLFFQRSKRNGGDAFPPSKADDGCTRDQRTSPSSPTAGYEVNDRRVSKRSRNDRMDSCLTLKGRRRSTWDVSTNTRVCSCRICRLGEARGIALAPISCPWCRYFLKAENASFMPTVAQDSRAQGMKWIGHTQANPLFHPS